MSDVVMLDSLADALTIDTPDDWTGTVAYVHGNVIGVNTPGAWATAAWRGGVLQVTSGVAEHLRYVIVDSAVDQIILATPFVSPKVPAVGDSIKLSGGPLSQAMLYVGDPTTLADEWAKGTRFFLVLDAVSGDVGVRGHGGRSHGGAEALSHAIGFELLCLTKNVTGTATVADTARVLHDLPIFKEQVVMLVIRWRLNAENNISGVGDVSWGKVMLQFPGTDPLSGYALEFDATHGRGV